MTLNTLQDFAAMLGIAISASGVIGWLLKVSHDRNIDAHDGIIQKVQNQVANASAQNVTLARIESALCEMSGKLDRFERLYWTHRAEHRNEGE